MEFGGATPVVRKGLAEAWNRLGTIRAASCGRLSFALRARSVGVRRIARSRRAIRRIIYWGSPRRVAVSGSFGICDIRWPSGSGVMARPEPLMKILFLARHFTYFRNFESVLRDLASRGHQLHLAVEHDESLGGTKLVQSLLDEFPNVTAGVLPERAEDDWTWTATRLRLGLDYLRYQHPVFDRAYKLRERSRGRTPGGFVMLGDAVHAAGGWARRGAETALRRMERAIPAPPSIRAFIEARRPDLMLLTPLIDLGSSQIDYLRAARELGVPTALCVWSWDHLSSKALIRECPERVFVWNETQKREAVELHRVPAERVVITGAQCFDHWFDRTPSRTRDGSAQIGLDARHPFILWAVRR
jgi:hypothetical protein